MIEQRVTLRYDAQQIPAIVQAVQGDTGRDVIFELADYEIPAGATANYYIDKPDGNAVYNSAEVISSTEILAHLTEQALAEPGRNNGQVRILSDGEVITSFDFVLEVEAFRGILRLQSETEVNIFDEALQAAADEAIQEILDQTPVVTGMQNSIAPAYSSSSTYAVGDYVMYNAQLYRCITAITTAEAWTAAHWTQVPLADDVSELKSYLEENYLGKRDSLSGEITLSTITDSGWYGIVGGATISDLPDGATHVGGLTLIVHKGTNASGNYILQTLIQGSNLFWNRVLSSSGTIAIDWEPSYNHLLNISSSNLSSYLQSGWYSISGPYLAADAPTGAVANSGSTLFVYARTAASGDYVTQIYNQGNPRRIWFRTLKSSGQAVSGYDWQEIAMVRDSYYKPITTISDSNTPLSSYLENGWYGLGGSYNPSDMPPGAITNAGATLFVFRKTAASSSYTTQLYLQGNPRRIWIRTITNLGESIPYFAWVEVTGFTPSVASKSITWYGDSTVIGQGGSGTSFPSVATGILKLISENLGVSGRSVSTIRSTPTPMVEAFESEITEKDILYFQGGTNDFWSSAPMGTIDSTDTGTFYGALNTIISRLQTKFPAMCIILGTPFRMRHSPTDPTIPYILPEKNSLNLSIVDYCDAIKEIGKKYCVPVIDSYNECGINPENNAMLSLYMTDGVHMNANGYKKIGVYIANKLEEYYSHD